MKTIITILFVIAVFLTGCDKNDIEVNKELDNKELDDGFCIMANEKVVLNHNDFEYYEYSSHLIYLKDTKTFTDYIESIDSFEVYANGEEIYTGQKLHFTSSFIPSGPVIRVGPSFYGDYIIPIDFIQKFDPLGNALPDLREDERIVDALKRYNQFHAGLSCEIQSIQYLSSNNVKIELLLKNNDSFNYYYIDIDKTGIGLFHYFTNGLYIRDVNNQIIYNNKIDNISVDPWNMWKKDWLSIIKGNESKTISIVYDNFEDVPKGQYIAIFKYPGLGLQVEKKDVIQDNGHIWLGELNMIKKITIE